MTERAEWAAACTLCGRTGTPLHEQLSDRHFDAPGTYSLESCSGCTLVWLSPMPTPAQISELYDDYYTHAEVADAEAEDLLRRAVTRGIPTARMGYTSVAGEADERDDDIVERWLGQLLSFVGPVREIAEHAVMWLPVSRRGRLLDVGCGSGGFLSRMRDFGWDAYGVEPDERAAKVARATLGDAVVADLNDPALDGQRFDAITLSHVIEHVVDPVETLSRCNDLLSPGGTLVCVTPNTASLGARSFGRSWLHWDPPRHLHLFDPDSLTQTVKKAGLRVQRVATPGSTAHFVWRASTLIERRGRLPELKMTGVSPTLWLESLGFWLLEYVLTSIGRTCGEEVLVVAQSGEESPA